jgi:hypothetical protein
LIAGGAWRPIGETKATVLDIFVFFSTCYGILLDEGHQWKFIDVEGGGVGWFHRHSSSRSIDRGSTTK